MTTQPTPTVSAQSREVLPVAKQVCAALGVDIDAELDGRIVIGIETHGVPLTTHNGLDYDFELANESYDAVMYSTQGQMENPSVTAPAELRAECELREEIQADAINMAAKCKRLAAMKAERLRGPRP